MPTVTQTIFFGYDTGTLNIKAALFNKDTGATIDSNLSCSEVQAGSGRFSFPTTANTGAIVAYVVFTISGVEIGNGWVKLAGTAGSYELADSYQLALLNMDTGGNIPVTVDATEIANEVVAQLGGAQITIMNPLNEDGSLLKIVAGASYTVANGQSIKIQLTGGDALIGAIPHLRLSGFGPDLATAPAITSGTQTIVFNDVLASLTSQINPGQTEYQVSFTETPDVAVPISGKAIVVRKF